MTCRARKRRLGATVLVVTVALVVSLLAADPAKASGPVRTAAGFAASVWASGFASVDVGSGSVGPVGVAFDGSGHGFVTG